MKILLIGGFGFLGGGLIKALSAEGAVVYVADRQSKLYRVGDDGINLVGTYATHPDIIRDVGFDVLINLASRLLPGTPVDAKNIRELLEKDFLDTVAAIFAAKEAGVKSYIFISSGGSIYEDRSLNAEAFKETDPVRAINLYGLNKLSIEEYLRFLDGDGFRTLSLRVSNIYSDAQEEGRRQGIIPIFIRKIFRDDTISIFGDGKNVRDFVHLDDAVAAIQKACGYQGRHKVMNIGSGVGHSVNDIVFKISSTSQRSVRVAYFPDRGVDKRFSVLDPSLAAAELSWFPRIDIDTGIRVCIDGIAARVSQKD